MSPNITFGWKGISYTVEPRAEELCRIVLPDGTVLQVDYWLETVPPQVGETYEVKHEFQNLPVAEIAQLMNACVAELAQ